MGVPGGPGLVGRLWCGWVSIGVRCGWLVLKVCIIVLYCGCVMVCRILGCRCGSDSLSWTSFGVSSIQMVSFSLSI